LDGSKNSFRGIEMANSVARQIGAILAITKLNQLKVEGKVRSKNNWCYGKRFHKGVFFVNISKYGIHSSKIPILIVK
jgi:hypothetical protein